ncbi:MAG: hypothetical protein ACOC3W_08855 [Thermodesulfobacteriota bacterium]
MRSFTCIGLFITILLHSGPVFGLWCGDALIMEDQSASKVREVLESKDCGELLIAEEIGSVREVVRRHDPFFFPHIGFYGHRYLHHGGYYGLGWRPGLNRIIYDSEKIEKWRVRIKNRHGVPYCYDLIFKSGVLRTIGIGDPCGSASSPE